MGFDIKTTKLLAALLLAGFLSAGLLACNRQSSYDPQWVREKYGLADAYAEQVSTPDGSMQATIVPVTLETAGEPISSFLRNGQNIQSTSVIRRACDPLCSRIAASSVIALFNHAP